MIKMANPLFSISPNYPQTQNLPTTINLDWLNQQQPTTPQNQGGFFNLQPYYSQINYPRTDIDFLNLNSDGVTYSRDIYGNLGRVAGVSDTAVTSSTPEIAATEAGQTEKQLLKTQATPVNAQQQSQTTAPVQQMPPATTQPISSLADTIKNYKSSLDAMNGNQNPTQLLNLKDATTSILPVIPDRNQYNNNSLLKLQNIEPENWTPQQWGWMGDIYSAKMAYEADTANINWYNQQLAKTDLSDADRKKYTDARDGLIKQRENVMNEAAMIRRTALANGFDIDAMGMSALGDNLGASTQAMNYFQERNRKSLLDLPTPKQFNNQRRKELDEQGYGAFHSLMLADKETSDYIDDASNRLLYAMQMDGTTNGVINNNGIGYLKQLSKIDPTSANIFMQEYASPAQGLHFQTQTLNNILNNDSALQRTLLNNQASYQQLLERLASAEKIAELQQAGANARNDADNKAASERQAAKYNYDVSLAELKKQLDIFGKQADFEMEFNRLVNAYGGDVGKATEIYITSKYSPAFNLIYKKAKDDKKAAEAVEEANKFFKKNFEVVDIYLADGNLESAKNILTTMETDLAGNESKYNTVIGNGDVRDIMNRIKLYQRAANGEITLDEMRKLQAELTAPSNISGLNQFNHDDKANKDAKKVGEIGANKAKEWQKTKKAIEERQRAGRYNPGGSLGLPF